MHPVPCRHAPRLRSLVLGDVGRTSERGPACCHGRPARRAVTAFPLSLLAPGCMLLTRRRLTGHLYSGERLHGRQALLLSVRGRDRRPAQRLGPALSESWFQFSLRLGPARACRCGFRTSLWKHAKPSRKGSHAFPAAGGTREQSPLRGPAGLHATPQASSPPHRPSQLWPLQGPGDRCRGCSLRPPAKYSTLSPLSKRSGLHSHSLF